MIPLSNVLDRGGITRVIPPHHLCWEGIPMKRPWAFICAASTTKSEALRRYCRALYTLGYVPVCPPIQMDSIWCWPTPPSGLIITRSSAKKSCVARFWCCAGRKPTPPPTHRIGLARKYGRIVSQPARAADGGREGRGAPLLRPYRLAHYLLAGFASIAFGRPNADSWGVPQPPVSKRFMKGHGDTHERI